MNSRQQLIEHLKRHGPNTVAELMVELKLSENAVRHHLTYLEQHGFLRAGQRRVGVGRPTKTYTLTVAAEGLFPKRYQELLFLFLSEARDERLLVPLVDGVVERLSQQ